MNRNIISKIMALCSYTYFAILVWLIINFIRYGIPLNSNLEQYPQMDRFENGNFYSSLYDFALEDIGKISSDKGKVTNITLTPYSRKTYSIKELENYPNLTSLKISRITNEMLKELTGYENIQNLDLEVWDDLDLEILAEMKGLRILRLRGDLTDTQWEMIYQLDRLETLVLKGCIIENTDGLASMEQLKDLKLEMVTLTDSDELIQLSNIDSLTLEYVFFRQPEDMEILATMDGLKELSLTGQKINDFGFIGNMLQLEKLHLDTKGTVDIRPISILNMTQLKEITFGDWLYQANKEKINGMNGVMATRTAKGETNESQ